MVGTTNIAVLRAESLRYLNVHLPTFCGHEESPPCNSVLRLARFSLATNESMFIIAILIFCRSITWITFEPQQAAAPALCDIISINVRVPIAWFVVKDLLIVPY